MHCLRCVSVQISWQDATCPPPSGGGAGGKSPLSPNDSNGSLKESGLIHHSTGTGHHPQSHHQTLISFYSMPASKTQCSRREEKNGFVKKGHFSRSREMGPAGLSLKIACFLTVGGWRGARDALSQTSRGRLNPQSAASASGQDELWSEGCLHCLQLGLQETGKPQGSPHHYCCCTQSKPW